MKTLLFDLLFSQPLDGSKFHGGGEYIKRVFMELVKGYSDKIHIIAFYNYRDFLDEWIKGLISEYGIETLDIKNIAELPFYFEKQKIDVFYTGMPYSYSGNLLPKGSYKIATFHGMRATECPHDKYEGKYTDYRMEKLKPYLQYILKDTWLGNSRSKRISITAYRRCIDSFDKVVCDSEHTKYSLLNYFPHMRPENIEVLYAPLKVGVSSGNLADPCEKKQRYILILSANRWIKNAYRGIKAIDDLYSRGHLIGVKTIVLGKLTNTIKKEINNLNSFIFYGYIEPEKLECLYKNCTVFLYATLNEGFGYPPLEAMRYGRTCVVSAVASLPEVCGHSVYYVNPYDIGEIQNRLLQALQKPIDEECVKKQFARVSERQSTDLKKLCELLANRKE